MKQKNSWRVHYFKLRLHAGLGNKRILSKFLTMGRTTENCDVKLTPPKLTLLFTFLLLQNRIRLKSSRLFFSQNRFFKSRSVSHAWIARASHATCAKCGYLTTGMYGLFCSLHRIELFNCCKNQRPERWFYWKVPEKGCRLSRRHSRKK